MEFTSLKPFESGFFIPYNVKDVKAIKINNEWALLVGVNNSKISVFMTGAKAVNKPLADLK